MDKARVYRLARNFEENKERLRILHKRHERLLFQKRGLGFLNWFDFKTKKYHVLCMCYESGEFLVRVRKTNKLKWVTYYEVIIYG